MTLAVSRDRLAKVEATLEGLYAQKRASEVIEGSQFQQEWNGILQLVSQRRRQAIADAARAESNHSVIVGRIRELEWIERILDDRYEETDAEIAALESERNVLSQDIKHRSDL